MSYIDSGRRTIGEPAVIFKLSCVLENDVIRLAVFKTIFLLVLTRCRFKSRPRSPWDIPVFPFLNRHVLPEVCR